MTKYGERRVNMTYSLVWRVRRVNMIEEMNESEEND